MNKWFYSLFVSGILFLMLTACGGPAASPPPVPKTEATRQVITPQVTLQPKATPKPAATPEGKPRLPAETPYYQGKSIEIVAATGVGGGTDTTARAVAAFLPKFIPGNPKIVVRNQPGAGGVTAINSFFSKVKPDGQTLLHGSSSAISNQQRGRDIVHYDLLKTPALGNIGESGGIVAIRKGLLNRLKDPKAEPLVMATRGGEETANLIPLYGREFLGWNVRWLTGFGGTGETILAFRRGEVDMFLDTGYNFKLLLDEGLAEPIAQLGNYADDKFSRRSDFPNIPTMDEVLGDKKPGGLPWEGYIAAVAPQAVYKFTVAAPGTPDNVVKILTEAYGKMKNDPAFNDLLRRTFGQSYTISIGKDTENLIKKSLEVSPEVAGYTDNLLRKFGVIK